MIQLDLQNQQALVPQATTAVVELILQHQMMVVPLVIHARQDIIAPLVQQFQYHVQRERL